MGIVDGKKIRLLGDWRFLLVCVTILGIAVRALPILLYPAWGSDLGIYYGITHDFISTGQFYTPYSGWGSSYNYFPVLYVMAGAIHYVTGADPLVALLVIGPIFGGLCVTILFFISRSINLTTRAALAASAILAVFPLHAYQTSHSAPLVMGHFFFLLSMLFFIKSHENRAYTGPLYISTFLLVLSHHFSTYMYVLAIIFVMFWQNLHSERWTQNAKEYVFYIASTLAITFAYWGFVAKPVYQKFVDGATPFRNWEVVVICYIIFLLSLAIVVLKRRYAPDLFMTESTTLPLSFEKVHLRISSYAILTLIIGCAGGYLAMGFLSISYILWALPVSIIVGFSAAGWSHTKRGYVHGWTVAIIMSGLYGIVTKTRTLFPERHLEYLAEPLAILAGLGLVNVTIESGMYRKVPVAIFIAALIAVNAASVTFIYSSGTFTRDVVTDNDLNALEWMRGNVSSNSVVASDHVLSMLLHSNNFTRSNEYLYHLWIGEGWRDALVDLEPNNESRKYDRIEYVFIDSIMYRDGVVPTAAPGTATYAERLLFTNESYGKFSHLPFELVYRNCSYTGDEDARLQLISLGSGTIDYMDISDEEVMHHITSWAEIYWVNWTYIESHIPPL